MSPIKIPIRKVPFHELTVRVQDGQKERICHLPQKPDHWINFKLSLRIIQLKTTVYQRPF